MACVKRKMIRGDKQCVKSIEIEKYWNAFFYIGDSGLRNKYGIKSEFHGATHSFSLNIKYIILNVLTLQVLYTILLIITDRLWISGIIFSVFTGVISLVNYYTIMYHGLPFSTMELHNITTALNVMHSYKIKSQILFRRQSFADCWNMYIMCD